MKYLNQFHKESTERKLKKIAESKKSPMSSIDAAAYMMANFERAKRMELGLEYHASHTHTNKNIIITPVRVLYLCL